MFCSCMGLGGSVAVDVLCASSGVAWFAGGDEFGVVSYEVVRNEMIRFCCRGFVAPMAEWVAL